MLSKEELDAYCQEYYEPVFKYCMRRLSKKEDAEDATQETFVVFSRKSHLIEEEHVSGWLFATAHNIVLKEYRKRSKNKDRMLEFDDEITSLSVRVRSFEEEMVSYYMERFVEEIYSRLSDREKELFDLCSGGNLKTGQISKILGLETTACSMRKKRLKEKCRDIMMEILFF